MKRDAIWLLLLSTAALIGAWLCGVRFVEADLLDAWHLLDVDLLRAELLRSLFYLHSQPPLLNFIVGIALKIGPAPLLLTALWSGCALAAAQCTRLLSLELGAGRWQALAAGGLVAISPATLLFVHHVGPEMATAAALVASALLVARRQYWAGFALLGAACLMRSLLAPPVVLLAFLAAGWRAWRPALALLVLLLALSAKNAAVAGVFATSSWAGMNFARVTAMRRPSAQRPDPPPFSAAIAVPGHTGVPALDQVRKRGGAVNYNNLAYAQASSAMLRQDLRAMVEDPRAVASGWALAWLLFFRPADEWHYLAANRLRIERWAAFWDGELCLAASMPFVVLGQTEMFLTLLLGLPLVFALSLRERRMWYALALVASIAILGNTFELGENYRFRFLAGPLWAALAAAAFTRRA